jgi:hypothetical protein
MKLCTSPDYCQCRVAQGTQSSLCGFGGVCGSQASENKELAATDNQQLKAKISTLIAEIYSIKPSYRGYSREEVISYLQRVETSGI